MELFELRMKIYNLVPGEVLKIDTESEECTKKLYGKLVNTKFFKRKWIQEYRFFMKSGDLFVEKRQSKA